MRLDVNHPGLDPLNLHAKVSFLGAEEPAQLVHKLYEVRRAGHAGIVELTDSPGHQIPDDGDLALLREVRGVVDGVEYERDLVRSLSDEVLGQLVYVDLIGSALARARHARNCRRGP